MAIKYILGIQSIASHDTGASIVRLDTIDNSIKYVCISEERLIRKKYPYTFPIHSILYCMKHFNIKHKNISTWYDSYINCLFINLTKLTIFTKLSFANFFALELNRSILLLFFNVF